LRGAGFIGHGLFLSLGTRAWRQPSGLARSRSLGRCISTGQEEGTITDRDQFIYAATGAALQGPIRLHDPSHEMHSLRAERGRMLHAMSARHSSVTGAVSVTAILLCGSSDRIPRMAS